MSRPWRVWILFALFAATVLAAMGWVSSSLLRLERENAAAQQRARVEEVMRLALWRIDSAVTPMLIEESARPYFDYWAFSDRNALLQPGVPAADNELLASPLVAQTSPNVNVYFNGLVDVQGDLPALTSPQVPPPELAEWTRNSLQSEEMGKTSRSNLDLLAARLDLGALRRALGQEQQLDVPPPAAPRGQEAQQEDVQQLLAANSPAAQKAPGQQALLNVREFSQRRQQVAQAQSKAKQGQDLRNSLMLDGRNRPPVTQGEKTQPRPAPMTATGVVEGVMKAVWLEDMLILGREVSVEEKRYVQGAWLNWDELKAGLLAEVADLLPNADLEPVRAGEEADHARMLATLPARLVAAAPAAPVRGTVSALRLSLLAAWVSVLVAIAAVAFVLTGVLLLSERRGAFVSAVTHELRTPLTTFRMYTEMLAEGLIKDTAKREQYLHTLHRESNRLGHLVENVLAYARLERGAARRVMAAATVNEVLDRIGTHIRHRAEETGMQLVYDADDEARAAAVRADVTTVGQILFNLVDNACKYAAAADDRRIHLCVTRDARRIRFAVRDHGPGLDPGERRSAFRPFRKSASQAARSAPGVGLGLALCRRLARRLGGRLVYDSPPDGDGARFCLHLPRADRKTGRADRTAT